MLFMREIGNFKTLIQQIFDKETIKYLLNGIILSFPEEIYISDL